MSSRPKTLLDDIIASDEAFGRAERHSHKVEINGFHDLAGKSSSGGSSRKSSRYAAQQEQPPMMGQPLMRQPATERVAERMRKLATVGARQPQAPQSQSAYSAPHQMAPDAPQSEAPVYRHKSSTKKRLATQQPDQKPSRLLSRRAQLSHFALCGNCYSCTSICSCDCKGLTTIGAVDGHSCCPIPYLISFVYGGIGPSTALFTMTPSGVNTYILAPRPPNTFAAMRAYFGFTDPSTPNITNATHVGELVLLADYVGLDEAINGAYMITGITTTQYTLTRISFTSSRCYPIGAGSYLRIRFGANKLIYRIVSTGTCDDNLLDVEPTNYDNFTITRFVHPVVQRCIPC